MIKTHLSPHACSWSLQSIQSRAGDAFAKLLSAPTMPNDPLMILLLTNNVWSVGQFKINWQKAALGLVFGKLELFSCKIGSKKNIARFAIGLTFCQKWTLKSQTINNMQLKKGRKQTFKICFTKCNEMQISWFVHWHIFVFLEVYHAVWGASLYLYSCCLYLYLPLLFAEVLVAIMQLGGGPLIIWACRFLPSKWTQIIQPQSHAWEWPLLKGFNFAGPLFDRLGGPCPLQFGGLYFGGPILETLTRWLRT